LVTDANARAQAGQVGAGLLKRSEQERQPAPVDRLAVLRLDGDMYESTIQTFENCYHKLSRGGIVIVDDYQLAGAKQATNDFRDKHGITSPILPIDNFGAWWTVDHPPILGG
jgi:O-methyltransferase/8-demethyl-8-(2,3-dimethoxy-alpha-L-rhamnosyl)tetracenomycin-C 4'-O-methyltransferase